jgi:hypothetical protein
MNALTRRIGRLEDQCGCSGKRRPSIFLIVCHYGWEPALDQDRCIEILGECGFLPTGEIGIVNLRDIPEGLNAKQTERFLRERGAETCGIRARRDPEAENRMRLQDMLS